jgi:hypothetical protein
MYAIGLLVHSWLRWGVLVLGGATIGVLARAMVVGRTATPGDIRLTRALTYTLDAQVVLGLFLYFFLSALSTQGLGNINAALQDPLLRFFTVEHAFGMGVGVTVLHAGLARAWKARPEAQLRRALITVLIWASIAVASVPWPFMVYGRPLFRF